MDKNTWSNSRAGQRAIRCFPWDGSCLVVFNSIRNNFVKPYCDCVISACIFNKTSKLVSFCVAILRWKKSNIFGILCFIISRKIKTQLKSNRFVQCMETTLWLIKRVKSGDISYWTSLTERCSKVKQTSWSCYQSEILIETKQHWFMGLQRGHD